LTISSPPPRVFRVAPVGRVWEWPDWARAGADRTFGNRYDDFEGLYRVLYAATARYGCYLETLARFRPDLEFYAALAAIAGETDHMPPGIIDADWCMKRRIGSAEVLGAYADIGTSIWLSAFRQHLACEILASGFTDFDAHVLFATAPRSLTQHISRMVYDNGSSGIHYVSKYGLDAECWAIFETRVAIADPCECEIDLADPDLEAAMAVHRLSFPEHADDSRAGPVKENR